MLPWQPFLSHRQNPRPVCSTYPQPAAAHNMFGSLCSQQEKRSRIDDGGTCFLITRDGITEAVSFPSLPCSSLWILLFFRDTDIKNGESGFMHGDLGVNPTAPALEALLLLLVCERCLTTPASASFFCWKSPKTSSVFIPFILWGLLTTFSHLDILVVGYL